MPDMRPSLSPRARAPIAAVLLASCAALALASPRRAGEPAAAGRRPWAFLSQHGISAIFEVRDARLYRELLPAPFELPERLLVHVTLVHYDEVTPALVPYHEAYVMLRCRYHGETGLFPLTMPVDDATANAGGRQIGFPKYVADRITLAEEKGTARGGVVRQGRSVIEVVFRANGEPPVTTSSDDPGLPCFTLVPPGTGPTVLIVRRSLLGPRRRVETPGTVAVTTVEPWGRLLDGAAVVSARRETISGDSIFVLTQR
jgi:hypothetical protein